MRSDADILRQFKTHKKSALSNGKQMDNIKRCQAFYAGDFMDYTDKITYRNDEGQSRTRIVQFNKVKPYVNAVRGFLAQNRRKPKFLSRHKDMAQRAQQSDYANNLFEYIRENANADSVETRQDLDMLVGGIGAVETCMTYGEGYASRDPNGEVLMMRLDPMSIGFDPHAQEINLLDARWVWCKKEYHIDDALELFAASKEEDFEKGDTEDGGDVEPNPRGGGIYSAWRKTYDWADEQEDIVNVYFYQWYDIEPYWRVDNPLYALSDPQEALYVQGVLQGIAAQSTGDDLFTFDPTEQILSCTQEVKAALEEALPDMLDFVEFKRKAFYRAVISGEKVFNKTANDSQKGFSIKFKTGDFDERNKIWVGMVNSMIDPVLYYNKALTEMLYTIATAAKGGVMYEDSAIEDIAAFERNYAAPNKNVKVADGALSGERIKPKREAYTPTGAEAIVQAADLALPEVNGIDKSFLGAADSGNETAALQRQRIKQTINTLACYSDAIGLYQKEHARMCLDLMRILAQNAAGLMFRMANQEDGQDDLVPLLPTPLEAEYDIVIEEAPDTATEKQERVQMLTTMGTQLLTLQDPTGKIMYAAAIQDMNFMDAKTKERIIKALMPQEQNQVDPAYVKQLEETLKQLQSDVSKANVENIMSVTKLNIAKIDETKAKTEKTLEEAIKIDVESAVAMNTPITGTVVNV